MRTQKSIEKRVEQLIRSKYVKFNLKEIATLDWTLGKTNSVNKRLTELHDIFKDKS